MYPRRDADLATRGARPGGAARLLAVTLSLALVAAPGPAEAAQEFRGRVVGVADGDTLTVLHDGRPEVVRLHGVDAPEKGQPFGTRARAYTGTLAFGQTVTVRVRHRDRYGRTVGEVWLPDGRSLTEALVRAGYAWWFRRYSADVRLAAAEAEARAAQVGLWTDPRPVPPWDWRRARREDAAWGLRGQRRDRRTGG